MSRHVKYFFLALIVWGIFGIIIGIAELAHAGEPKIRLNVALTCEDINELVAWRGWPEIESRAKAAGAGQPAIDKAKKCLVPSGH